MPSSRRRHERRRLIGFGEVRHTRLRPAASRLSPIRPASCCCRCAAAPRRPAARWRATGRGLLSFHDRDHGDGGDDALAWLDAPAGARRHRRCRRRSLAALLPAHAGLRLQAGELLGLPPRRRRLRAVVAEVNNTFGERHCYLLDAPVWARRRAAGAQGVPRLALLRASKAATAFRFLFAPSRARTVARIDYDDDEGALLRDFGQRRPAAR